jgi:hypothetical protein
MAPVDTSGSTKAKSSPVAGLPLYRQAGIMARQGVGSLSPH